MLYVMYTVYIYIYMLVIKYTYTAFCKYAGSPLSLRNYRLSFLVPIFVQSARGSLLPVRRVSPSPALQDGGVGEEGGGGDFLHGSAQSTELALKAN